MKGQEGREGLEGQDGQKLRQTFLPFPPFLPNKGHFPFVVSILTASPSVMPRTELYGPVTT